MGDGRLEALTAPMVGQDALREALTRYMVAFFSRLCNGFIWDTCFRYGCCSASSTDGGGRGGQDVRWDRLRR